MEDRTINAEQQDFEVILLDGKVFPNPDKSGEYLQGVKDDGRASIKRLELAKLVGDMHPHAFVHYDKNDTVIQVIPYSAISRIKLKEKFLKVMGYHNK